MYLWPVPILILSIERVRLKVLDSISVYDYQKSWKYSRKQCLKGTSSWIFEKSEWKDWLSYSSSVSLCCTGICKSAFHGLRLFSKHFTPEQWVLEKLFLRM